MWFYIGVFVTLGIFALSRALRSDESLSIALRVIGGVVGGAVVCVGIVGLAYRIRFKRLLHRARGSSWM